MLHIVELERGTSEVFEGELPVAKLYNLGDSLKVHMYKDSYEFETDSIETATKLIQIRWERPDWN